MWLLDHCCYAWTSLIDRPWHIPPSAVAPTRSAGFVSPALLDAPAGLLPDRVGTRCHQNPHWSGTDPRCSGGTPSDHLEWRRAISIGTTSESRPEILPRTGR